MSTLAHRLIAENKKTKATRLDLGNCGLTELPEEVFELEWLEELNFRKNKIRDLTPLEKLSRLKHLDFGGNKVSDLTPLEKLSRLKHLNFGGNQVSDLTPLEKLTSLTQLYFYGNQVSDLTPLEKLTGLTQLYFSGNEVSDLTPLVKLTRLTQLNFGGNQVSDLTPLEKLTRLTQLNFGGNQVSDLTPLEKLTGLTQLYFRSNLVSDLTPLEKLAGLTQLDFWSNQVSDLTPLEKLTGLTQLGFSKNQVSDLKPLEKLTGLTQLNFLVNQVCDLKPLEKLTGLTQLDFSSNKVSDLTPLEKLTGLTQLDFGGNKVSDLTPLEKLTGLTQLHFSGNQVSHLTPLEKLTELTQLAIRKNKVSDLKPLLPLIKKDFEVHWGNFKNNPWQTPLPEIIQQGNPAILRYFEEKERLEKAPDAQPALIKVREAKVLLVGQGKSGKTTLRKKLEDPDAEMPAPGDSTRGIEITRLDERMPHTGEALRLNVWDFGGQDIQHYAHQFFLTGSSLYALVTNERIQDSVHLPYWLNIIEMLGKKSPVILIQNMDGGICQPLKDEAAIRARFGNVHNRTFQSDFSKARTEAEFGTLRKKIVELAAELPHIERVYLRSFNELREKLEAEADRQTHYLRWEAYLALMPELGEDLMRDYAIALTFLGVCQYFPGDAQLRLYVFLRPKWLIDALFELLLHEHFEETRGLFSENDTFKIWQGKEYQGMHALLVRMMKEFELCYRVEGDGENYIVPQRLPGENKTYGWDAAGDVPVQFRYKFMPKGILTRLICRLHPRIEKDPALGQRVWNDAVIFTLPDGKGRVFAREVYSENTIELRATGAKHAEMLNEVIRKMDDLNRDTKYDNLQVEKMVPCPCAECTAAEAPGFHEYEALMKRIEKGKSTSECKKSGEDVSIDEIFGKSGVTKPRVRRGGFGGYEGEIETEHQPLKVFISYSKDDKEKFLTPMTRYLNPLMRGGLLETWDDRKILPGEEWDAKIKAEINKADVIFLLVSTHSLNTDYIWNVEIEAAMQRQEAGEAIVVPIILSTCEWTIKDRSGNYVFPPAEFNALPEKGKPVDEFVNENHAWKAVADGIKAILEQRKG